MILTMDMLENMLAEASSTLDAIVHLSPETAGAVTPSASAATTASPAPCRSNISTPSPPSCDEYDELRRSAAGSVSQLETNLTTSDVLSASAVDVDVDVDVVAQVSVVSNFQSIYPETVFLVRPFYERAVSNLDRSMHRSLWD